MIVLVDTDAGITGIGQGGDAGHRAQCHPERHWQERVRHQDDLASGLHGRVLKRTSGQTSRSPLAPRQTLNPLVQELVPMNEHQRIDAALGDQPDSDDCLSERRRSRQDTSFVLQHRLGRELLLCSELALKGGM